MNNNITSNTTTLNAYKAYTPGDKYENLNGDTYTIIALSEERDKALLLKVTEIGTVFYVGAKGLMMHHWNHGHYFMNHLDEATKWFTENDDEEMRELFTVEDLLFTCVTYEAGYNLRFIIKKEGDTAIATGVLDNDQIPSVIKESHVQEWECDVTTKEYDLEFFIPEITIHLDTRDNPNLLPLYKSLKENGKTFLF